ncbi:MAG: 50S ribosomal protein L24 [Candidatus Gracilibacteria bacterium]
MKKMKIHTGDIVRIIAGKNKFRIEGEKKIPFEGKVLQAFPDKEKIIVEGANIITKHVKKQGTTPGQKIQFEKPIHVSNVMLICPDTKKPTRVRIVQGKTTDRISVKSGKKIG